MSARDPFGGDPEDLGVRARRGLLGRGEQRELERATESSATVRIAYEIGRDMDAVTGVRGGDDALIASAASAALARTTSAPVVAPRRRFAAALQLPVRARGRRMLGAAAIVAGVVLVSGVAAALWSGMVTLPLTRAALTAPAQTPVARRQQRPHRAHVASQVPNPPAIVEAVVPIAEPVAEPIAAPERATSHARRSGAAELFHAANAARRDGDFTRAAKLYAELRADYPESDEGELARVSLAQLWLARGRAAAAEREFRAYLARGRGQLTEEALVGQAQSLLRLGKAREERASLQRLLTDFPHSVYAAEARARLLALEHEDATSAH